MRRIWVNIVAGCVTACLPSGVLLSQHFDAFEALLASAQQAQARSDFKNAAEFYRQAVAIHPEIAEIQANLGLMYYQTGKDEDAALAFRQAIRLKPSLFVPTLFLGLDYLKLKRCNEAIPLLKRAAVLNPTDVQVQLALGQAYAVTGNTRLAIRSYVRATELDSTNTDSWYRLGVSYLEQVESDARILLTRYKDSGYLRALMADNFFDQRALIQSAEAYKRALASAEFPPETHANYGFVLLNQQDLVGAERELNAELKTNPGSLTAQLGLARLQVEQGASEKAANEIQEIWEADADFFRANVAKLKAGLSHSRRSALQKVLERKQMGVEVSREILVILGDGSPGHVDEQNTVHARELDDRSDKPGHGTAAESYAKGRYRLCRDRLAPRLQVLRPDDLQVLALCSYLTGDYRLAFDSSEKLALRPGTEAEGLYWETRSAQRLAPEALGYASALDSGSPKLHVLLGDLYRQRNFFPSAEQEYQKALALVPNDTGALFGLSLALLADNQLDQASDVAQSALKNNSNDPELNAVMGEILCARNDFLEAEVYLKKSLNTKPEYVSHVHALLGSVYAKTDRTQEAIAELKLALSDDKDGHIHYQIARLYLKVGDRNSANEAFEISTRLRSEGLNRAAVSMQQTPTEEESQ